MNQQEMNIVQLPFIPGTNFFTMKEIVEPTTAQLRGKVCGFSLDDKNPISPIPGEPMIRRIVDVGAGVGAFAAYAAFRWPYAWIDCYEADPLLASLLKLNLPPGGRIVSREDLATLPCDLLHIGDPTLARELVTPVHCGLPREDVQIAICESIDSDSFIDEAIWWHTAGLDLVGSGVFERGVGWQAWCRVKEGT